MEILAGIAIGACVGVMGRFAYDLANEKKPKPEKREYVYLMRVSQNGRVEIKTAPAMLWNWKY